MSLICLKANLFTTDALISDRADRIQAEARQSDHIRRTLEEVKKTAASKEKNQRDASYSGNVWQQQQQQGSWQVRSPGGNNGGAAAVDDLMEVDDRIGKQLKR